MPTPTNWSSSSAIRNRTRRGRATHPAAFTVAIVFSRANWVQIPVYTASQQRGDRAQGCGWLTAAHDLAVEQLHECEACLFGELEATTVWGGERAGARRDIVIVTSNGDDGIAQVGPAAIGGIEGMRLEISRPLGWE